jgi:hypothetical protein
MAGLDLRERLLEGGNLSAQLAATFAGQRHGVGWRFGSYVESGRHLTRVDASPAGLTRGVGGYLADRGWFLGGTCHKCARPLAAVDQPLLLQALIDRARGVGVDPEHLGKLAQAGQALAWREPSVADPSTQSPCELNADRDLSGTVDREVFELELCGCLPLRAQLRYRRLR